MYTCTIVNCRSRSYKELLGANVRPDIAAQRALYVKQFTCIRNCPAIIYEIFRSFILIVVQNKAVVIPFEHHQGEAVTTYDPT